jgi:AcrR family transcriptional regulator
MGRLINREKIERAKEQRSVRKRRILDEASSIFARMAYSTVTMDTIGQHAGFDGGVASMYFRSKEELFLIVFRDFLAEWLDDLERRFGETGETWDRHTIASVLAHSLTERPVLTRLSSLLPVVLEQDIEAMVVFRFQKWRSDRLAAVGNLMEERTDLFGAGEGFGLLNRLQLVAGGLEIAANPRGAAAFDRNDPDFAGLWVDMEPELREVVTSYLDRSHDDS